MPPIARVYVRTGLLYLALAVLVGPLIAWPEFPIRAMSAPKVQVVYFHLFMLGWVTQLIFGVAWWMFPLGPKENPRGSDWIFWLVYVLLNVGLLIRAGVEPFLKVSPSGALPWLLVLSSVLQMAAGWLYVFGIWPRVRGPKKKATSG